MFCVLCFTGVDPDSVGQIRYSISGPVFSVDRDTGVVRLRQELDREKQNTIEVIISITGESVNFDWNSSFRRQFVGVKKKNQTEKTNSIENSARLHFVCLTKPTLRFI